MRRFIEIRGLERIRLDPDLIDERETARRAGSKHEFGTAYHLPEAPMDALEESYKGAEPNGIGPYSQPSGTRQSFIPTAWPSETLADARRKLVAHLAVGIEPLLAGSWVPVGSAVGQYSTSAGTVRVNSGGR